MPESLGDNNYRIVVTNVDTQQVVNDMTNPNYLLFSFGENGCTVRGDASFTLTANAYCWIRKMLANYVSLNELEEMYQQWCSASDIT